MFMSKRIWLWLSFVFLFVSVDAFAQIETWGSNFSGQIGDGMQAQRFSPGQGIISKAPGALANGFRLTTRAR